jgi:GT2 family glycosyltransferase
MRELQAVVFVSHTLLLLIFYAEIYEWSRRMDKDVSVEACVISQLSYELASLQERYEYYLGEFKRNKANAEDAIRQRDEHISQLSGQIPQLSEQISRLSEQISAERMRFTQISSSTIWRATKPLRVVLEWLRRFNPLPENHLRLDASKLDKNEQKTVNDLKVQTFNRDIKISIITPLYNTDKTMLTEMIESVLAQTYSNWELCLADGSDDDHSYVGQTAQEYSNTDKRILYRKLRKNYGISRNSNAAMEMANGEYLALLDHDDVLHPSALYYVMQAICEKNAEFVYTDESTFKGALSNLIFIHYKPDFALENLRGNNYLCHFSAFSRKLLDKADGGFRTGFDGAQDHDLFLRLVEQTKEIVHVPEVLYYWRAHENSTALSAANKPYAMNAGLMAVQAHLYRTGIKGAVCKSSPATTIYRIKYDLLEQPLVSIIIPNKDNVSILKRCVSSILFKSTYRNIEILIIENNSVDSAIFDYYKHLEKKDNIKIHTYDGDFNYSKINNWAVGFAHGKHLLFLNNDTEVISESWIEEMLMFSQRPTVGAVSCMLYYLDDTIQHAGMITGTVATAEHSHVRCPRGQSGYAGRLLYAQDLTAVTGACMMVRKDVFESVNGFEECFAIAFNDVDLCMKIRKAQYDVIWTPFAELYHHESLTRGHDDIPEKQDRAYCEVALFKERWEKELESGDPYYNPNFEPTKAPFTL